ncbi:nuclear transport factor 2 family protein [Nocardia rhizosphaerae]|uniref:Nuclear transport factor 2 family protein n=1 Tax=Nocardia rhizosphaerae TaxID=1691571 RepID=A0ABV8LDV6_9NOCA
MSATLDPVIEVFVDALNAQDTDRFRGVLTEDATVTVDGTEHELARWTEIFDSNGRLDIASIEDDGTALTADYTTSLRGPLRTTWRFELRDGLISRVETERE